MSIRKYQLTSEWVCSVYLNVGDIIYKQPQREHMRSHKPFICTNCSASHGLAGTCHLAASFYGLLQNVAADFWSLPQTWWFLWYIFSSLEAVCPLPGSAQSPSSVPSWEYAPNWIQNGTPAPFNDGKSMTLVPLSALLHLNLWDQNLTQKEWLGGQQW